MPLLQPGRRLSRPRKLRPPLPQKARPRLRKTRSLPSPYRKPLLCRPCPRGLNTARPSRRKLSRPSKRPSMTQKTRGRACKGPPLLLSLSPRRPGAPVSSRLRQPCPCLLPAVGPCPPTIPNVRATAVPPHPGRRIRLGLTDRMPQHAPDLPEPAHAAATHANPPDLPLHHADRPEQPEITAHSRACASRRPGFRPPAARAQKDLARPGAGPVRIRMEIGFRKAPCPAGSRRGTDGRHEKSAHP